MPLKGKADIRIEENTAAYIKINITGTITKQDADQFHDSAGFIDEATNIQTGTAYLQHLIDKEMANAADDPISEAYKDYRGIRNGVYYQKIKMAAEQLKANPDSMQVLRDMVK